MVHRDYVTKATLAIRSLHWGNVYTKLVMIGGMEGKTCK